jgi:hypothetical protein
MATGPLSPSDQRRTGTDIALSAVIGLVAIILLHQPWMSLHNIFIGTKTLTFVEMAALKLLVGAVTALLVVSVCALALRRLSVASILTAASVQVLWIELEWGFSMKAADGSELMVRFSEELGVVSATIALMLWKLRRTEHA